MTAPDENRINDSETIDRLVSQAAAGDRDAANELLERFWPLIRSVVRDRLNEAVRNIGFDDITQEAALHLLQKLPTYRCEKGKAFGAWVRVIAESVLIDHVRKANALKRGRRLTGQMDEDLPSPAFRSTETQALDRQRTAALEQELQGLPDDVRRPIVLHTLGYSFNDIGDILGCTPEAARKRVTRGTEQLRGMVKERRADYRVGHGENVRLDDEPTLNDPADGSPAPTTPRLDVREVFTRCYAKFRVLAEGLSTGGALIAAIEDDGQVAAVEKLDITGPDHGLPYFIVGRHSLAHVKVTRDPRVALRHLLVRLVQGSDGTPEVVLHDLRTGQGFAVEGLGPTAAVRSSGPVFARLGSSLVMVIPRWTWPVLWPGDAGVAWEALPRLRIREHVEPEAVAKEKKQRRPTTDGSVQITVLPPVSELVQDRRKLSPGEHFGDLSLLGGSAVITYPVTRAELARGVLVGRSSRCQLGEALDAVTSWSRLHVLVIADGNAVKAYDLASTPGTIIDALHINHGDLGDRSILALGSDVHLVWQRVADKSGEDVR